MNPHLAHYSDSMLSNAAARRAVRRVLNPLVSWLVRRGVSPDVVTVAGTLAIIAAAIGLGARGYLFAATIVITLCAFADLLDGEMARATNRRSTWGAFLDSTADRIADGAMFGAVTYWLATQHRYSAVVACLLCLVLGAVVPYARAKAEGLGFKAGGGFAERAERLIILGCGALLASFGLRLAVDVALWTLAALAAVTVVQRGILVYRQAKAADTAEAVSKPADEHIGHVEQM